jgi:hypothetical protein
MVETAKIRLQNVYSVDKSGNKMYYNRAVVHIQQYIHIGTGRIGNEGQRYFEHDELFAHCRRRCPSNRKARMSQICMVSLLCCYVLHTQIAIRSWYLGWMPADLLKVHAFVQALRWRQIAACIYSIYIN